eukprot:COSAG05_NODE_677_length_7987_cov_37.034483_3_plen_60_part_00
MICPLNAPGEARDASTVGGAHADRAPRRRGIHAGAHSINGRALMVQYPAPQKRKDARRP